VVKAASNSRRWATSSLGRSTHRAACAEAVCAARDLRNLQPHAFGHHEVRQKHRRRPAHACLTVHDEANALACEVPCSHIVAKRVGGHKKRTDVAGRLVFNGDMQVAEFVVIREPRLYLARRIQDERRAEHVEGRLFCDGFAAGEDDPRQNAGRIAREAEGVCYRQRHERLLLARRHPLATAPQGAVGKSVR
jgi:hypothetical protein